MKKFIILNLLLSMILLFSSFTQNENTEISVANEDVVNIEIKERPKDSFVTLDCTEVIFANFNDFLY